MNKNVSLGFAATTIAMSLFIARYFVGLTLMKNNLLVALWILIALAIFTVNPIIARARWVYQVPVVIVLAYTGVVGMAMQFVIWTETLHESRWNALVWFTNETAWNILSYRVWVLAAIIFAIALFRPTEKKIETNQ